MKEYATLYARQLQYGTADYSRPYPERGPQMTNLNDMQEAGWRVIASSIVPSYLTSHGYSETQFVFILERERPAPSAGESRG